MERMERMGGHQAHGTSCQHGGGHADGCGGCGGTDDALQAAHDEGLATGDAPMASCCARDLDQRREANRVLRILREADISTARERRARDVVVVPTPTDPQIAGGDDDVDGNDDEFERYRRQRMAELKRQSAAKARGAGCVKTVDSGELKQMLQAQKKSNPPIVCKFSVLGSRLNDELDEIMDTLAAEQTSVSFVRIARPEGFVMDSRQAATQPALCWFERGNVQSALFGEEMGGPGAVEELLVRKWVKASAKHHGEDDDEDNDDGGDPCKLCGRTYPHEHIRNVRDPYESDASSSSGESEDSL